MKPKDKPVYPDTAWANPKADISNMLDEYRGTTLLEYYAGLAMQGLLASGQYDTAPSSALARFSVDYAKQLIKQLENEGH